jgi:hypothetical protein
MCGLGLGLGVECYHMEMKILCFVLCMYYTVTMHSGEFYYTAVLCTMVYYASFYACTITLLASNMVAHQLVDKYCSVVVTIGVGRWAWVRGSKRAVVTVNHQGRRLI